MHSILQTSHSRWEALTGFFFFSSCLQLSLRPKPFRISLFVIVDLMTLSSRRVDFFVDVIAVIRAECYCFESDGFGGAIKRSTQMEKIPTFVVLRFVRFWNLKLFSNNSEQYWIIPKADSLLVTSKSLHKSLRDPSVHFLCQMITAMLMFLRVQRLPVCQTHRRN